MFDFEKYKTTEGAWLAFRRWWFATYPPLDNGYYLCGICGHWVHADETTLDHIEPRTADNIYQVSNIQPAHGLCNYKKGSRRWAPVVNKETYEFLYFISNL